MAKALQILRLFGFWAVVALTASCASHPAKAATGADANGSEGDTTVGDLAQPGDAADTSSAPADVASVDETAGDASPNDQADAPPAYPPCLSVTPSSLDFGGAVPGGAPSLRSVNLCNCGKVAVLVSGFDLVASQSNSSEFAVDQDALYAAQLLAAPPPLSATNPLTLPVGHCQAVGLRYAPVDLSAGPTAADQALFEVPSSALGKPTVAVQGLGVASLCPQAVVQVAEGAQVVPQTLLHLQGKASKALSGGGIAKYLWTVKQPPGTNQPVLANPAVSNPTLLANATGTYTFCLEVWDEQGLKSCTPACQTVLVVPDTAIHIELLWDTPADPNQFDSGAAAGADLDLHFANPMGAELDLDCDGLPDPWFTNPWDTFWFNGSPQWGSPAASVKDDPTLDLDDTDGAGPENLNLIEPDGSLAEPVAYSVGVHYWHDHGYGPSYATVAIWILGSQVAQLPSVKLDPLDMWYVGKLWWPNAAVGGNKKAFETCYQSGYSCAAGKNLMWAPTGNYCVTKCYNPATFLATVGGGASAASCVP